MQFFEWFKRKGGNPLQAISDCVSYYFFTSSSDGAQHPTVSPLFSAGIKKYPPFTTNWSVVLI
jgi:hypothetical protein